MDLSAGYMLPWYDKKREVSEFKILLLIESIRAISCTSQRCKNAAPGRTQTCDRCKALEQAQSL